MSGPWQVHLLSRQQQSTEPDNIAQGSVTTHLRRGGIFSEHFIANFLKSVPVTEF